MDLDPSRLFCISCPPRPSRGNDIFGLSVLVTDDWARSATDAGASGGGDRLRPTEQVAHGVERI